MWDLGAWLRRWLEIKPRITVIAAALAAAADALALAKAAYVFAVLLVLALLLCGLLARRKRLALFLVALFVSMYAWAAWNNALEQRKDLASTCPGPVRITAVVDSVESSRDPFYRLCLTVVSVEPDQGSGGLQPAVGAIAEIARSRLPDELLRERTDGSKLLVRLDGTFQPPRGARFPWEFDQKKYLQRQGIYAIFRPAPAARLAIVATKPPVPTTPVAQFVDVIRGRMVELHRKMLGDRRGDLLSSMVIGDKAVRPVKEFRDQFRMLGLSHIVAASGFNLTVVTAVAWWTFRFLFRSPMAVSCGCFTAIGLFCAVAGLSASVERAAIMCVTMLIVGCTRRSVYLPASVCLALILTLFFDPFSLFDAGAQLSYVATMAIALAVRKLNYVLTERLRCPKWLAEAVVVVVLANSAVLPLQMIYFWQIGELSLPANILVSPLVPPITVLGFVSSTLAAVNLPVTDALAIALDWVAGWPLDLMICIVYWLSLNRWSLISVGMPGAAQVTVYYLALGFWYLCLPSRNDSILNRRTIAAMLLLLSASVYLFWRPTLNHTTIVCWPDAILVHDPQKQPVVIGNAENISVQRAATFLQLRDLWVVPFNRIPAGIGDQFSSKGRSAVFQLRNQRLMRVDSIDELR